GWGARIGEVWVGLSGWVGAAGGRSGGGGFRLLVPTGTDPLTVRTGLGTDGAVSTALLAVVGAVDEVCAGWPVTEPPSAAGEGCVVGLFATFNSFDRSSLFPPYPCWARVLVSLAVVHVLGSAPHEQHSVHLQSPQQPVSMPPASARPANVKIRLILTGTSLPVSRGIHSVKRGRTVATAGARVKANMARLTAEAECPMSNDQ